VEGIRDGVARTPEKMEHYLETIYSRAVMLDRLIDELFLYSRLDLKRVPFNFEKVDLDGFLRRFFQELASDYESLCVDYKTAGMEPMIVIADRVHLRRVLSNLIENSVKYNDKERTSIRVRMEPAGESVSVSIHDNGPGIEAGALPHIFERYFRGGSKQTSNEGSGLGLAIARQIIEAHGGRIWAENDDGTVFHFTLKRALS